jgi:hypothetical protein
LSSKAHHVSAPCHVSMPDQEGVSRARSVAMELFSVTSRHALANTPHHLGVRRAADPSSLEALPVLTALASLALAEEALIKRSTAAWTATAASPSRTNLELQRPCPASITTLDSLDYLAANCRS